MSNKKIIHAKSPLGILGSFIIVMRKLFNEDNNMHYVWNEDPSKTKINIQVGNVENYSVRNKYPSIFVNLTGVQYQKKILGNNAVMAYPPENKGKASWAMASGVINFTILANAQGECMQLMDWVSSFLVLAREEIEEMFNFQSIEMPQISAPQPFLRDQNLFQGSVIIPISWEIVWLKEKVGNILNEIAISITEKDSETELVNIAINSIIK